MGDGCVLTRCCTNFKVQRFRNDIKVNVSCLIRTFPDRNTAVVGTRSEPGIRQRHLQFRFLTRTKVQVPFAEATPHRSSITCEKHHANTGSQLSAISAFNRISALVSR